MQNQNTQKESTVSKTEGHNPIFDDLINNVDDMELINDVTRLVRWAEIMPRDITLADVAAGWSIVWRDHDGDDQTMDNIERRRAMSCYFVTIAGVKPSDNINKAIAAWDAWLNDYEANMVPETENMLQAEEYRAYSREYGEIMFVAQLKDM